MWRLVFIMLLVMVVVVLFQVAYEGVLFGASAKP
jgi:hypothetical protein